MIKKILSVLLLFVIFASSTFTREVFAARKPRGSNPITAPMPTSIPSSTPTATPVPSSTPSPQRVTVIKSPTVCQSGSWLGCEKAFSDDGIPSTAHARMIISPPPQGLWKTYVFNIPNNAVIKSVTVNPELSSLKYLPLPNPPTVLGRYDIAVSINGTNFGSFHLISEFPDAMILQGYQTYTIDVTNDLQWTPQNINNIVVSVKCEQTVPVLAGTVNIGIRCGMDHLPVTVEYELPGN